MTSLFAKIIRQAKITFDHKNIEIFRTNFYELKLLVDQLKIHDLNVNTNLISREAFSTQSKAPCTFVDIYENDHFTMSVFILKQNFTMPIHDHPKMFGILRCIAGNLKVQSFSASPENDPVRIGEINVKAEPSKVLTTSTESAILTPKSGNYHEITAGDEISAFFDILAPPYESPIYGVRKCSFYRKIEDSENVILQRVPTPSTYYCDSGQYDPPDVLKSEM